MGLAYIREHFSHCVIRYIVLCIFRDSMRGLCEKVKGYVSCLRERVTVREHLILITMD